MMYGARLACAACKRSYHCTWFSMWRTRSCWTRHWAIVFSSVLWSRFRCLDRLRIKRGIFQFENDTFPTREARLRHFRFEIKHRLTSKNVCTLQRLYHSLASGIVHLYTESWISGSLSGQGWGGHVKDVNILIDEHLLPFFFSQWYLWWCKLEDCFLSATACMEICAVSFLLFMAAG